MVGRADGFDWYENELLNIHTNGNDVTGVAVNDAAVAEGASTLAVDGLTNTTGTTQRVKFLPSLAFIWFTPLRRRPNILSAVCCDCWCNCERFWWGDFINQSIVACGFYRLENVSALPADDAALVFMGGASSALVQNLAYQKRPSKMVSVPYHADKGRSSGAGNCWWYHCRGYSWLWHPETPDGNSSWLLGRYFCGTSRMGGSYY